MFYDTVIQGAEILDRNDGKTYQVGIKDGRIAYIGQEPVQGSLVSMAETLFLRRAL